MKLPEKAGASRLSRYKNTHSLNNPLQSVYKAEHSAETALKKVQNNLLMSMDKHGTGISVLVDLNAAFDMIDKAILLHRMETVLSIVLEWSSSCLSDLSQSVKMSQATCVIMVLFFVASPGSVLGPLLCQFTSCLSIISSSLMD